MSEEYSHITDKLSPELFQTTETTKKGKILVVKVNPDRVLKLIEALQAIGIYRLQYSGESRILNPELAKIFARSARGVLEKIVDHSQRHRIALTRAENWGSTISGLVKVGSDIDIALDYANSGSMEDAIQKFYRDDDLHRSLWRPVFDPSKISNITLSFSNPSAYVRMPQERWIPEAHHTMTIPYT